MDIQIRNILKVSLASHSFSRIWPPQGFTVDGDSMPPHEDGDVIIAKYIERLSDLVTGRTYIIMTKNDGIVYKRLNKNKKNLLIVESDESFYSPYEVKASEIEQIWEFKCNIGKRTQNGQTLFPAVLKKCLWN